MNYIEENLNHNFFDSFSNYFFEIWSKINNTTFFFEIGIVLGIIFISFILQKWLQHYCQKYENQESGLLSTLRQGGLSVSGPMIVFFLTSIAMSVSGHFTSDLAVYHLTYNVAFIWFVWILANSVIHDLFVRAVICGILIPLLILSTLGLSTPVIDYLDSLAFSLGDLRISLFLILKTLLIATCIFWVAHFITKSVFSFIEQQKKIDPQMRDLIKNLFQIIFYVAIALITFDLVGIDLKSLTLLGGAIGIGIGLGLQKIASNFISGIIILFEQNIKVGHLVEVSGSGNAGWIRHLGARAAVIDTGDGKELLIPNEELLTKTVTDWTSQDRSVRTDLRIKVSFRSDLEKAKKIMLEAARAHPFCSKNLGPSTYLEKFSDSGAQFLLQFWVDDLCIGKMEMQNDVLFTIWKKFAEENIEHAIFTAQSE